MLKDITLGQYFPGNSVIHRMDARVKIVLSIVMVCMLFMAGGFVSLATATVFILFCYALSRVKYKLIFKSIKPVMPLIIFTAILNLFFITGDNLLFHWGIFTVYFEGVRIAIFMVIRVIALIVGMSLLTYTSSPVMLTDAIESLLSPLKKLRFPVHELAMMMTIALRFIPTLIEETDKIMMAQKARGAELDTGGLMKKAKALVPILIPLFVSAFKRANELAIAMECRCYRGGAGRTRLKQLKMSGIDAAACAGMAVMFAAIIVINIFAPF
jgi:energy-coupling factor transport system permease protein